MSPSDFDDIMKFQGLVPQSGAELKESGQQAIVDKQGSRNVDRGGNYVIARLASVDMVIRMNGLASLGGQRRNDFVGIHVGGSTASGLKYVNDEMGVVISARDCFGRHDNCVCL